VCRVVGKTYKRSAPRKNLGGGKGRAGEERSVVGTIQEKRKVRLESIKAARGKPHEREKKCILRNHGGGAFGGRKKGLSGGNVGTPQKKEEKIDSPTSLGPIIWKNNPNSDKKTCWEMHMAR